MRKHFRTINYYKILTYNIYLKMYTYKIMILCQTAVYFKNSSYKTYWQIMAYKPNLACCLFLYNPWAKNGCYIFKWLKKIFCDVWKSYEIQILMSTNKFCWHTTLLILLYIVCGYLQSESRSFLGGCLACLAKCIYYLTLYRPSLLTYVSKLGLRLERPVFKPNSVTY